MSPVAVACRDVWKRYRLWHERRQSLKEVILRRGRGGYEDFWAVKGVSFEVERGEAFGIIGANGSGKSTLLKVLADILVPEKGEIVRGGRISALLELGAGFHPELSGRENVYLNGSILGLSRKEIDARFDSIAAFSELGDFIDTPIRSYSSGMTVRLGFSVAVHSDPDILLVDEVLAVGDEAFQRKCAERIQALKEGGTTIILVSHNLNQVRGLCYRAIWMDQGEVASEGLADNVVRDYVRNVERGMKGHREVKESPGRVGSGEVEITDVETFGAEPGVPLTTGGPATIRISYRADERVERPAFGFGLHRAGDDLHVSGPNTRDGGVDIPEVEGAGEIEFVVDRLPLLPGRYLLTASVTDHTLSHPYDIRDRAFEVEVRPGENRESRGVVTLSGRWVAPTGKRPQDRPSARR